MTTRSAAERRPRLRDEQRAALRELRDLDDDHARGLVDDDDYRRLRASLERRAAAELDRAHSTKPSAQRSPVREAAATPRRRRVAVVGGTLAALLITGTVTALLLHSTRQRSAGETITGGLAGSSTAASPATPSATKAALTNRIEALQRRVRAHPQDLSAWLDLASADLTAGRADDATAAYLFVLGLQPDNAAAGTGLALVLFKDGRVSDAFAAASHVVRTTPAYPDAYYARGLIELMARHQPKQARDDLRHYLALAPRGPHTDTVRTLLALVAPGSSR